jgi:hypothetical protein
MLLPSLEPLEQKAAPSCTKEPAHRRIRLPAVTLLFLVPFVWAGAQENETRPETFGGQYIGLLPDQKRLIDDWFGRFSNVIGKPVDPEEGYDALPFSVKTTFSAVTHALIKTTLTDSSGEKLADSAIALVEKVDTVAGGIPGAGGDKQFRMYVELRPGAVEILENVREFKRGPDNTIYHKGYPTSYRGATGVPSIQVSVARDHRRADIDVDYRSSKFPAALVNGHLASSNSDVRAGNNDERHNAQWAGLGNWWRNLLGLPISKDPATDAGQKARLAREPRAKGHAKPEDAIHDLLNTWLVEQKPEEVISYFDEETFACMEIERGEPVDRGMARLILLRGLQEANRQIGKPASLADVSRGAAVSGPRVKPVDQPHDGQFALYQAREDLAEQLRCSNRLEGAAHSEDALSEKFGKYYAGVFRVEGTRLKGDTIATLWTKSHGYWKMISYDVDPLPETYRVPDTGQRPPEEPEPAEAPADKELVRATQRFLEAWFLKGDIERAFDHISARAYSCVNVYREADEPPVLDPAEQARRLRAGLQRLADLAAKPRKLQDAIRAVTPGHPDIRPVRHSHSAAYSLASLPDYIAAAADCAGHKPGVEPSFQAPQGEPAHGTYYATGFKLAKGVQDPAVLWTLWAKEGDAWMVTAFAVVSP